MIWCSCGSIGTPFLNQRHLQKNHGANDLRSPRSPRRGRSAFAKPAVDDNRTKTKCCHRETRENWSSKMLWSSSGLYDIYIYDMIWWYMYISECIDINYAYVRIGVVSWIPLGPFWCGFILMFLDSLPATILPRHGFWVNYSISPTWIVGPFGDDFPY